MFRFSSISKPILRKLGLETFMCLIVNIVTFGMQVSERDDKLLQDVMDKLRMNNEEKSGDEDSEEEEDTGMGDVDVENAGFHD